jgi:hypothetical protein
VRSVVLLGVAFRIIPTVLARQSHESENDRRGTIDAPLPIETGYGKMERLKA